MKSNVACATGFDYDNYTIKNIFFVLNCDLKVLQSPALKPLLESPNEKLVNTAVSDPDPTLADYRANVEALFNEGSSLIIENRDRDHAAILISTLFRKAEKEVCVLSQKLESKFYARPEVEREIISAIERGVAVKIVSQEKPETVALVQKLQSMSGRGGVSFRVADPDSPEASVDFNFAVVDRRSFRFETDREACSAFASANNSEVAEQILNSLKGVFDSNG